MFKSLIANHAGSVYEPEALYFLALMSQDINDNQYAKILNEKHPYSSFARQLKKGNIKLSEDMEASAQASYANAFRYFENNDYQSCLNILEENLNKYTGSQIEDKMALLRLLSLSKLGNKNQYVVSLNDFIRSYPTSTLVPKARQMLSAVNK
jgi:outer membrane protein assembly factor BamD (BamD/ComL family)